MDLPPEIRNMIYGFAVVAEESIHNVGDKRLDYFISLRNLQLQTQFEVDKHDKQCFRMCSSLLSTSWTTNREVMPIFFLRNHFEFGSARAFEKFFNAIPKHLWSLVANITIENFDWTFLEDMRIMTRHASFVTLKVGFTCGSFSTFYDSVYKAAEASGSMGKRRLQIISPEEFDLLKAQGSSQGNASEILG